LGLEFMEIQKPNIRKIENYIRPFTFSPIFYGDSFFTWTLALFGEIHK